MASGAEWNKFILENNGLFLQSWKWGELQKSLGRKVWRLGDCENWAALVIRYDLPLGKNYLYCPAGPVLNLNHIVLSTQMRGDAPPKARQRGVEGKHDITSPQSPPQLEPASPVVATRIRRRGGTDDIIEKFLNTIKKIAKQEKSIFFKIEPFWPIRLASPKFQPSSPSLGGRGEQVLGKEINIGENGSPAGEPFSQHWINLGFKKASGGQRVLKTLVLDLTKTEEELLAEMKQKTRYNIKLAERHGVKIRISDNIEKDVEYFWNLAQETSKRDGFKIHPKEHYKKLLSICHPESANWRTKDLVNENEISVEIPPPHQVRGQNDKLCVKLFLAEYQGRVIAANIVVFFGGQAIYLHGASSNEHRNLMAPYLLQWEQIKEAKKRGCEIYDFWGIDENKWPGITRFKTGFGGKEIFYIGAYDYVFDRKWYFLYNLARRIKKC